MTDQMKVFRDASITFNLTYENNNEGRYRFMWDGAMTDFLQHDASVEGMKQAFEELPVMKRHKATATFSSPANSSFSLKVSGVNFDMFNHYGVPDFVMDGLGKREVWNQWSGRLLTLERLDHITNWRDFKLTE